MAPGSQWTPRWREMDSNPRSPGYGGARFSWRRATRPMPPRNARSFALTSWASDFRMPDAPFTWTKAGVELEIGLRDFEHAIEGFSVEGSTSTMPSCTAQHPRVIRYYRYWR